MTSDLTKHLRSHASLLFDCMISVKKRMLAMTKYVHIVIDNADVYESSNDDRIKRYASRGQNRNCVYASTDIYHIDKAAVECIDIIDKHAMPK